MNDLIHYPDFHYVVACNGYVYAKYWHYAEARKERRALNSYGCDCVVVISYIDVEIGMNLTAETGNRLNTKTKSSRHRSAAHGKTTQ